MKAGYTIDVPNLQNSCFTNKSNYLTYQSGHASVADAFVLYYDCLNGPIRLIYSRLINSTFT